MATQHTTTVSVEHGRAVHISGDAENASYARDGVDLVLTQGEESIIFKSFFAQGEGNPLPKLVLSDGSVIAAKDFLQAQNPDMDLTTAAGNTSQVAGSGTSYSDDAGELIGGVDTLGSLGTTTWGGREPGSFRVSAEPLFNADAPGMPIQPQAPEENGPGPVVPPSNAPDAHLQVSKATPSSQFSLDLKGLTGGALSNADVVEFSFAPGTEDYFTQPTYQDGKLVVSLTPAGLAALQNGTDFSGNLLVTINDQEYEVLLDGARNPDYQTPADSEMKAEWYESDGTLQNADVSLAGQNTNTVNVGGTVKDSNVVLADSALGNIVTIDGDYTDYNTYSAYDDNGDREQREDEGFVGIFGSTVDAGGNGVIDVNVSNADGGQNDSQYVAGIAGYRSGTTTVKGDEINISAEMSTQHGSPVYDREVNLEIQLAYGIDNRDSITNVEGREIVIEATGRADNMSDPGVGDWEPVNSPNVLATGVKSSGLEHRDENGDDLPQNVRATVNISGKEDVANSIHISANAVAPAGNDLHTTSLEAIGIQAGTKSWQNDYRGDVTIDGGSGNDTIVIESFAEGIYGGPDNGDMELNATGVAIYGINGGFDDEEFFSKVYIDGGDGHDRLDITASTSAQNDTDGRAHANQSATGADLSNGRLSINNVEEVNITATNEKGPNFIEHSWSDVPRAVGIAAWNSDISIINDDQLKLSVKSDGQGILLDNSDLTVHSGGNLNVEVDAVDGGINVYKPGRWPDGEEVRGTTSFTADGDLTMKITVSDASSLYETRGSRRGAGIETVGGSAATLIRSGGKMDLTVDVHTSDQYHHAYAIYTQGGLTTYHDIQGTGEYKDATLTIESLGQASITLVGDVYAVGGSNYITTYDGNDVISISGTIVSNVLSQYTGTGYDYHAGLNQIDTGAGDDTVSIDGDLHAKYGDIIISTGEGKDVLNITGDLKADANGKIDISTGEGHDVLNITGDLKADANGKIDINMGDGDDMVILNGSNITGNVVLDGGIGDDTLVFKFDVADGTSSLTDALDAGKITGFENLILDITNGADEALSLDTLLDSLYKSLDGGTTDINSNVYIKGDAGDTVSLGNGWSAGERIHDGETEYTSWSNGEDVIYIQSQVGVIG